MFETSWDLVNNWHQTLKQYLNTISSKDKMLFCFRKNFSIIWGHCLNHVTFIKRKGSYYDCFVYLVEHSMSSFSIFVKKKIFLLAHDSYYGQSLSLVFSEWRENPNRFLRLDEQKSSFGQFLRIASMYSLKAYIINFIWHCQSVIHKIFWNKLQTSGHFLNTQSLIFFNWIVFILTSDPS